MAATIKDRVTNIDVEVLARSPVVRAFMVRTYDEIADPLTGHVFAVILAKKAAEAFDLFHDDRVTAAHALLDIAAHVIALECAIRQRQTVASRLSAPGSRQRAAGGDDET
jgi:hypothetical protein